MKKVFISLFLCIFFLVGIACEKNQKNKLSANKNEVSFCNLFDTPEKYESKTVQTKAIVLGFHSFIFYSGQCLELDKVLALEMNYESRRKLIEAIKSKKVNYSKDFLNNNLYAEITVLGELKENDKKEPEVFDPQNKIFVFHPKYKFFVNEIKNVNILSEEIFPNANQEN